MLFVMPNVTTPHFQKTDSHLNLQQINVTAYLNVKKGRDVCQYKRYNQNFEKSSETQNESTNSGQGLRIVDIPALYEELLDKMSNRSSYHLNSMTFIV